MKARRGVWPVFGVGVVIVTAAMAWITASLLDLEAAQQESRADAAHAETLRLALWRMDSWLGPAIAAEAVSVAPPETRLVRAVYDVGPDGALHATRGGDPGTDLVAHAVDVSAVRSHITDVEHRVTELVCVSNDAAAPVEQNVKEYASRAKSGLLGGANGGNFTNQIQPPVLGSPADSGPLVASWVVPPGGRPELVFVRRALSFLRLVIGAPPVYEDRGHVSLFVADWPAIERGLLEQVSGILPDAKFRLLVVPPKDVERGFSLASIPVAIDAPRPPLAELPRMTPTRITLGVAWSALAFAFVAVGVALRRTMDLSERRNRFASSVTHELRTPLTTFRLYSEMLADGMVTDPAQRQTYLDTLKGESSRLAHLVENVLAYSRVEEGRLPVRREQIRVADLLLRATPPLDRRAAQVGATLRVEAGDAAGVPVNVDPDVVGQVLFNLVDNAAKYAASATDRTIAVTAAPDGDRVRIVVRDHGPGIDASKVRAAFTPFERAGRPAGDTIPGIGLGLALSRALARDLGGDLGYEPGRGGGAAFVLTLPVATRA